MSYAKSNLNLLIKVKLTEEGIRVVEDIYSNEFKITIDDAGYWTTQTWNFINIFGEYMTFGIEKYMSIDFLITEKI